MLDLIAACLLGLCLGMRHALEPDHLAAVSTLLHEAKSPLRGMLLGAWWGIGHSASLLAVGLVLALLHAEMPAQLANAFELAVAVMLVVLGLRAILRSVHKSKLSMGSARARRPLIIGIIHGLAGSGALTALVIAGLPTTTARVSYIALFGLGSTLGMAAMSGLATWPLGRFNGSKIAGGAGALSCMLGLAWAYPILLAWR